ncbi:MAG: acetyl-CoA carboxylase biotin carboxyl carrier protein [Candidatus Neomarinimicrobiota bacterium]
MWQNRLKRIIDMLESRNVNEIEVSFWGRRFRVSKGNPWGGKAEANPGPLSIPAHQTEAEEGMAVEDSISQETDEGNGVEVRAPMVGTFYRAPSPESAPYVNVGSHVGSGQALCIIEAMKIMNEIESEITGRVAKILVENTQAVEYGQLLFLIEPD